MRIHCPKCNKAVEFTFVDPSLDKENGWKCNQSQSFSGCRGVGTDYNTTKCNECGYIATYDFQGD